MNREQIVDMLGCIYEDRYRETHGLEEAASRILAAIEKEREGEVVVGEGKVIYDNVDGGIEFERETPCGGPTWVSADFEAIHGNTGQLIFRPTKGKGE